MEPKKEACVLCAWRESCQKKFSMSGKDIRCPDFARDVSIKQAEEPESTKEGEKKQSAN